MSSLASERPKHSFWSCVSLSRFRRFGRLLTPFSILLALGAFSAEAAGDDVLTQHNDNARTGAQLHETSLKPGSVGPATFGRLYERTVDGQIIAQPLYASNPASPGTGMPTVALSLTP